MLFLAYKIVTPFDVSNSSSYFIFKATEAIFSTSVTGGLHTIIWS